MKRSILAAAVLALFAVPSRAEIVGGYTIEWLSCSSEVIVIGKLAEITATKKLRAWEYEDCIFEVAETIKGHVDDNQVAFTHKPFHYVPSAKTFLDSERLLLFLSRSNDFMREDEMDGGYVPTALAYPLTILDLSHLPKPLYSKDMRLVTDPEDLLQIVRTWADAHIEYSLMVAPTPGSPLDGQYPNVAVRICVPAEEKYRALFLELARSYAPHERARAASELFKFPGEETERVLRELLKDETKTFVYGESDVVKVEFGVRAGAWRSLEALGKPVPALELERKPTEQERRLHGPNYWRDRFAAVLPEGWGVASTGHGVGHWTKDGGGGSVVVTCAAGALRCRFVVIPTGWDEKDFPNGECLGVGSADGVTTRYFHLDGDLPEEVKALLINGLHLEKPRGEAKPAASRGD